MTKPNLVQVADTAQKTSTKTTTKKAPSKTVKEEAKAPAKESQKPVKSVADKLRDLQKLQKMIADYEEVQGREGVLGELLNGANDDFITLELTITNSLENYNSPKKEITFRNFQYIKDSMQVMHKSMTLWLEKTKMQIDTFEV